MSRKLRVLLMTGLDVWRYDLLPDRGATNRGCSCSARRPKSGRVTAQHQIELRERDSLSTPTFDGVDEFQSRISGLEASCITVTVPGGIVHTPKHVRTNQVIKGTECVYRFKRIILNQ